MALVVLGEDNGCCLTECVHFTVHLLASWTRRENLRTDSDPKRYRTYVGVADDRFGVAEE